MDRLVKPDVKEVYLVFTRGQKCQTTFRLTNLMHTMSVAVSLTTTNPSLFSFAQSRPFTILPPLSTSSFTLSLSQPSDHPPLSTPALDTIFVRSTMLPTGKAHQDDLSRMFSISGPHIFKDATIPISLVGPHVVEFLLSPSPKTLEEVAFLLPKAISCCDESQVTSLLSAAILNGNTYFVPSLIDAGADLNRRDTDGRSVMSLAIRSGNIKVVQILIDSGYKMDNSMDLFLHESAAMERLDLVEILCLGCRDLDLNSVDSKGQTALHVAAFRGNLEMIEFLLLAGVDSDVADSNGWTPLHCASNEGHERVAKSLLDCSTYVKYAVTKDGKTAFGLAVENGHSHLYDVLHLGDVLHRSARVDDVHGMKSSLAEGAEVNGRDQNGWTPLHRAAFKGRMECVKLLLNHGALVDAVDDDGYTPFHRAVETGHVEVALCLVAHGARANVKGVSNLVNFNLDCMKNQTNLLVTPLCQEKERT